MRVNKLAGLMTKLMKDRSKSYFRQNAYDC